MGPLPRWPPPASSPSSSPAPTRPPTPSAGLHPPDGHSPSRGAFPYKLPPIPSLTSSLLGPVPKIPLLLSLDLQLPCVRSCCSVGAEAEDRTPLVAPEVPQHHPLLQPPWPGTPHPGGAGRRGQACTGSTGEASHGSKLARKHQTPLVLGRAQES
ncbi:v-maf avian musculoaponeurotic fibrosarcoma oncogene homolog F [Columba livia]|uniref:V-maf avian musculoaponeurotic fibrosarcoma oncogene homolog F n=1 Tax=Columba livia TaxID=8932 RepID=A0A2I0MJS6_COLLI|nr:v-maf avian musculoaponeurotic fibrosarcoma oncogene homolog F [Columba livia]